MPVSLSCNCGRALRVKDELAGKKIHCPQCRSILTVPASDSEAQEVVLEVIADEDEEESSGSPSRRAAIRAEPPRATPVSPRSREDDRPTVKKRPVQRRDRERGTPRVAFEEGWFGSMNAGVIGGILMILIAAVWFIGGLFAGVLFFYPPILAVIGFIAIIKGCVGGD